VLWCETGGAEPRDVEELAVFVRQLRALGLPAGIHVGSIPAGLTRNVQFDLAPHLFDHAMTEGDRFVLTAAHRLSDAKLARLRRLAEGAPRPCTAFGRFGERQSVIGVAARLSYVLGTEPELVDVTSDPLAGCDDGGDCPVFGAAREPERPPPRPRLLMVGPELKDGRAVAALVSLALSRQFDTAVLTDGSTKGEWLAAQGARLPVFHFGEVPPSDLAARVEICALFAPAARNYRLRCLIANLAVGGAALLDCTAGHGYAATADAFLRAPVDPGALAPFLASEILPNLDTLATHVRQSRTAARCRPQATAALAPASPAPATAREPAVGLRQAAAAPSATQVVFMPTNGVGLGHAQRCSLVAAELDPARVRPVFAVFPSCAGLVKAYGFDAMPLVARSKLHAQTHENDLANYLRLRALAEHASALVFDGGYIFDSVYRTLLERRLRSVWIRRGLWQPRQDNTIVLDREKAFERVVVPSEAFEELNATYSHGEHVRAVGPIVQRVVLEAERRDALRAQLAERYGRGFDRLVVTQLGGGVAAERGAQIQAICGMMQRRADVLHLVVVWPTTVLEPAWFGWSRTRVVKTHHAGVLSAAADLCITAAGYNSFHEVLYGARSAIFVPQTASYLDDQHRRAQAAHERGLAGLVEPHELMRLEREIARRLDDAEAEAARRRLAELDLPEPGNARAAALIEEVIDADATLGSAARPDRSRRRG